MTEEEPEIDVSRLTVKDFETLIGGNLTFLQLIAVLDRATAGGVKHLPITELAPLVTRLYEALCEVLGITPMDQIDAIARRAWEDDGD